ncbi:U-box domain-containing protein 33-like [Triticum dicoccoides]|uniref:U-box domain-containing protein 33-like n=1 Tax=Triticum dicoccoides TaxID=85692 RepID=UPI0018914E18|nr:U-box domain-containing protein 33-like [Triticum dicoccoides]
MTVWTNICSYVHRKRFRHIRHQNAKKTSTICLLQKLTYACISQVQAEKLVVESDDVAEGLVQLITEHHVTALVMGAAADKHYTKKMKALKSKKAQVVEQRADPSCKIWYICKGTLVYRKYGWSSAGYSSLTLQNSSLHLTCYPPCLHSLYTRKAVPLSHGAMPQGTQKPGAQQFSVDRSTSLSEMWCVSNTWLHKPNLRRSDGNEKETVHEFDEADNKFQHMLRELESVRKQAYEDNCSREKAERELFEAFQKARASENMYFGEVKQKNQIEDKLKTTLEEVERLTETTNELCAKLQDERKKRLAICVPSQLHIDRLSSSLTARSSLPRLVSDDFASQQRIQIRWRSTLEATLGGTRSRRGRDRRREERPQRWMKRCRSPASPPLPRMPPPPLPFPHSPTPSHLVC